MAALPRLKKSETLEIRLPYPTKLAFMASCQEEGRSASETLRCFIEQRLERAEPPRPVTRQWLHLVAGALITAAVGAAAVPSLARPSQHAEFDRLDLNGDHVVSVSEFARFDSDHDGKVSFAEYRARPAPASRP